MRIVVKFVLFFVFASCSNIKVLNDRNFYSAEFLQKIESIQVIYKDGDKKLALTKLEQIFDNTITKAELAKKYNLKGIIYFSLRNLEVAIENFEVASKNVDKDLFLANKIHLNLASSFYKLDRFESTLSQLKSIDVDYLKNKERTNYHKLSFSVGNQLGDYKLFGLFNSEYR
jgi:tetratricopeptide (TPR) repeat protein